jgi:hypothetical protein
MTLNDILNFKGIDPAKVLVFRHRPNERKLNKVFPWLAAEKPECFNAYQSIQSGLREKLVDSMVGKGYIASFIRHGAGKALFVGLYSIEGSRRINRKEFWSIPEHVEMKRFDLEDIPKGNNSKMFLDLVLQKDF